MKIPGVVNWELLIEYAQRKGWKRRAEGSEDSSAMDVTLTGLKWGDIVKLVDDLRHKLETYPPIQHSMFGDDENELAADLDKESEATDDDGSKDD